MVYVVLYILLFLNFSFIFRYFTRKWQKNANYRLVATMYESDEFVDVCPCKYVMAFNICRLNSYKNYSNLTFNNEYSMRSLHFSQKITSDIELINIETIYAKTDILSDEHYNILTLSLPASTIVTNTRKIKDMRNSGVEQVKRMLKYKPGSSQMSVKNLSKDISDVFGKKYTNYYPSNIACMYYSRKPDVARLSIKKTDKAKIIKSIMVNTERVKNEILSGRAKLEECNHRNFTKEFHQLRAADEAAHRVLTCVDCGRIFNVKS